jgi:hypothetical protein
VKTHLVRAVAFQSDLDVVLTGRHIQTLERAVEVINDAGIVTVDIDLG